MQTRTFVTLGAFVLLAAVVVTVAMAPSDVDVDDENATVLLSDGEEIVAEIDAEIAATEEERYTGLSEHDSLPEGHGMLFVHEEPDDRTYVMREMDFGIDILFVDSDGCLTAAHAASEPDPGEDGSEQRYSGYAEYVIEVNEGVATDAGVEAGDPVRIEYDDVVVDGSQADC